MKRFSLPLVTCLLLVTTACGGSTASPSTASTQPGASAQPSGSATAEKQTLKVWTRNYTVQDPTQAGSGPSPFFSARVPMRCAACTTIAVTAGLMP